MLLPETVVLPTSTGSNRGFLNHANALPVQGPDVAMTACCPQVGILPTTHKLAWRNSWNNTIRAAATLKSSTYIASLICKFTPYLANEKCSSSQVVTLLGSELFLNHSLQ